MKMLSVEKMIQSKYFNFHNYQIYWVAKTILSMKSTSYVKIDIVKGVVVKRQRNRRFNNLNFLDDIQNISSLMI